MTQRAVAVIGGGVTGLVAARALASSGCAVTLFEASPRLGGQIRTVDVLGHAVDIGAESLHLTGPTIVELLDEIGLTDELVTAETSFAWLWDGQRRRRLPAGVGPAGPTRLLPVAQARILSPLGMARAALEPLVSASAPGDSPEGDVAVGPFIARRFGRQVADRLVDPVLGSLHAGDVDRLSLRAATPMLAAKAAANRSLLVSSSGGSRGGPSFHSFPGGLITLIEAMLAGTEVVVRLGTPVTAVTAEGDGFRLDGSTGELGSFDGIVVALPAAPAADVLGQLCGPAAEGLRDLRTASVATVVVAYPIAVAEACPALQATGVLVSSGTGSLLKAATFLGTKWPQLRDDKYFLIRLSAGRVDDHRLGDLGDDELVEQLLIDFGRATGLTEQPVFTRVDRWPHALPQLEVGHLERLAAIRSGLEVHRGLRLAGAAYEGLGIATCMGSGLRAADELCADLDMTSEVPT